MRSRIFLRRSGYVLMTTIWVFSGCWGGSKGSSVDSPTQGHIRISVDNTFEPIIQAELDIFQYDYKEAHIKPLYKPEAEVIQDLLADSTKMAITTRKLTNTEREHFKAIKIDVKENIIARDGIALVVNKANSDTAFTLQEVRQLFEGQYKHWSDHKSKSIKGKITVVFDNPKSSTIRFIKEIGGPQSLKSKEVYSLKSNEEVVNYVETNKEAIGVIGVNWIANNDSAANKFSAKVKVVAIAPDHGDKGAGEYYKPYQAYIAQGYYPLSRNIYVISVEGYSGLGTGFAYFLSGDKGQRIFLKSGIVPVHGIVRIVEFKSE